MKDERTKNNYYYVSPIISRRLYALQVRSIPLYDIQGPSSRTKGMYIDTQIHNNRVCVY